MEDSLIFVSQSSRDYFTLRKLWDKILTTYCSCALTIATDRADALGGVAEKFAPRFGFYILGLWSDHLHESILWTKSSVAQHLRRDHLYWPSWSWCSRCSAAGEVVRSCPGGPRGESASWRAPRLELVHTPQDVMKHQPEIEEWAWLPSSRYLVVSLDTIKVPIKITMNIRDAASTPGEGSPLENSRKKQEVLTIISETGTEFSHSTLDYPNEIRVWVPYDREFTTMFHSRFERDYNITNIPSEDEFYLAPIRVYYEYHELAGSRWYTYDMQCLVLRKMNNVFERIGTYSVLLSKDVDVDIAEYPLSFFSATSGAYFTEIIVI